VKKYSIEAERKYYSQSRTERGALPYEALSVQIRSSFGAHRFAGLDVLDVGGGEGVYSAYLADVEKAEHVITLDLTPHRMRTNYMASLENLHFVAGDLFTMPFPPSSFDLVFIHLVLHHLRANLGEALLSISKVLRSHGVLLAIEPNFHNPAVFLAQWWRKHSRNEGSLGPHEIERTLRSTGFENVHTGYFWRDRSWARNSLLGSGFFIEAKKSDMF